MKLTWLCAPLVCEGRTLLPGLSLERISDAALPEICLRMHLVLETVEFERCEGRLIDREIFDSIDLLTSHLSHANKCALVDWYPVIAQFAEHYGLEGNVPVAVAPRAVEACTRIADQLRIALTSSTDAATGVDVQSEDFSAAYEQARTLVFEAHDATGLLELHDKGLVSSMEILSVCFAAVTLNRGALDCLRQQLLRHSDVEIRGLSEHLDQLN